MPETTVKGAILESVVNGQSFCDAVNFQIKEHGIDMLIDDPRDEDYMVTWLGKIIEEFGTNNDKQA